MSRSRAGSLSLVGGALALDFANTASDRGTPAAAEHLGEAGDVLAWAVHAGAADRAVAERASAATADPIAAARLLRKARRLRDAVHCIGAAVSGGAPPAPDDTAVVLEAARDSLAGAGLARSANGGYRLDLAAAPAEAALLGPVAWSMLEVLAAGGLERLKQCPGCGWLFLDRSKNNSRRWCDMATCGNVAKGRRHRARR